MIGLVLTTVLAAVAAPPAAYQQIEACLDLQDVACAEAIVARDGLATSGEPGWRAVAAEVAFTAGDYPRAVDLLQQAVDMGLPDAADMLAFYQRTLYATAGWVEVEKGRFRVRYRPGADAILADDAAETLERTDRFVTPLLGPVPPGRTVVELFPSGRTFVAASSLTLDDVRTTGVVALSKFSRLLLVTPRARSTGYPWRSSLSHEYVHLVVMHATANKAPVWLQEGIATYLDDRWASGRDAFRLAPEQEGYLAKALAERALVPFEEMHPSLAKIKVLGPDGEVDPAASARRSQLAYGQLASLIAYAFERGGEQVLLRTLPAVRDGEDPREALRKAVGAPSFDVLLRDWETWVRAKGLVDRGAQALPLVLDGGSADEADPVLARRKDLANALRLGDLLAARGHHRAALVAFDRARAADDGISPILAASTALSHLALGEPRDASDALAPALEAYPEFADAWRARAAIAMAQGDVAGAAAAYRRVIDLAPFRIDDQEALLGLLRKTGDAAGVAEAEAALRLLRRGGEDVTRPPIHVRYGTYELPRDPKMAQAPAGAQPATALDAPAPDFQVDKLDGGTLSLAELRGKVVVLDFWATWCGPCKAVMPKLSELAERHADAGLVVVGISDEPTATVRRWLDAEAARGRRYAQIMALEGGAVRRAYGVSGIPHLVVIDPAGRVRKVHVGAGDLSDVSALVAELLGVPQPAPDR